MLLLGNSRLEVRRGRVVAGACSTGALVKTGKTKRGDDVNKDSSVVVVSPGKVRPANGELIAQPSAGPSGPGGNPAIQAATLKLLDALERRALKTSKRNNGSKPTVLEDEDEEGALPSGMPTLLLSETGWGGGDTDLVEDRLYAVINTAADTLVTQMSGQQYEGICLAFAGSLFSAEVGELMASGEEESVSETITHLTDVLEAAVRFLATHFAEVFVPCVPASGWARKTTASADIATLLDRLVYQMLQARVADLVQSGKVTVEISQTACLAYALYGTNYLLMACGGEDAVRDRVSSPVVMHRKDRTSGGYDYIVTGNRGASAEGTGFIANGALNSRRPQQALWITHPANGISTLFSIFGESWMPEKELPAYRALKPVALEVRIQKSQDAA